MAKIGIIVAQQLPDDSPELVHIVKELRNQRRMLEAVINELNKEPGLLKAVDQNYS